MPLLNLFAAESGAGLQAGSQDGSADRRRLVLHDRVGRGSRMEIFPVCANPSCDSGWIHLWRPRKAPVFEGGWSCSPACTARLVGAAVRRELSMQATPVAGHRHRIPLGLTMLEQGWISHGDLRTALAAQRASGGRLGGWLVRGKSATEERVTRALGLQWSCPVLHLGHPVPENLSALVPRLFVDAFGVLPLRVAAGRIVYLGFRDRPDPALALAAERMTGLQVEMGLVAESQFLPAQERLLRARFPQADLLETETEVALAAALTAALEQARTVEARLVRVHECLWLRMWLSRRSGSVPDADSIRDVIGSTATH